MANSAGRPSPSFEQLSQTRDMRLILSALLRFLLQSEVAQAKALQAIMDRQDTRDEKIYAALRAFAGRLDEFDGTLGRLANQVDQHTAEPAAFSEEAGDVLHSLRREIARLRVVAGDGEAFATLEALGPAARVEPLARPATLRGLRQRLEQIDAAQRDLLEGDRAAAA